MLRKDEKIKIIISILCLLFVSILTPVISGTSINHKNGFEKGITWQPFKPIKKTTFVNFDKETLVDDYSYLASIPASVFNDGKSIYTNPLLFFQKDNTYPDEDKYRFLNDYSGTHYLMEDWMKYCNGKLDKLTTINVEESELESTWNARKHKSIKSNDPYKIASEIALDEWSYSNRAVLSVIEKDYEKPEFETKDSISGSISGEVGTDHLTIARPYGPASEYEKFEIEKEYKYVKVDLWYPSIVTKSIITQALSNGQKECWLNWIPGFGKPSGFTIPSVDPDLQIFCKYEGDWLQTAAASNMAITLGPHEQVFSYVYNPGDWRVGVTNMPTEGGESFVSERLLGKIDLYGTYKDAIRNIVKGVEEFNVEITKYPGVEKEIIDTPPFGCRDATFTLKWDNDDTTLGLTIIGPNGEELDSVMNEDVNKQEIHFNMLGECLEGEHYKAVVYALDDISYPVEYTVEYDWKQNISRKEGDLLASACQGAVLGSTLNNPMLYVNPDNIPTCTKETLYKLGVNKIDIVDIGGYLSEKTIDELSNIAEIKNHYREYKDIYDDIIKLTDCNDVVFSTIDPWSYWYYKDKPGDLKPDGEYKKAFYFAPAAYAAAHHGTPLLLIDNHAELSGAATWHIDFWRKNANGFTKPPIACMFKTGKKVYDFLDEYGFDKKGAESILTVAGQYEIGPSWTRMFTGPANPGSIIGTPIDVSNHISRCIFYPALIFENPAVEGKIELENGSKSVRSFHVDGKLFNVFEKFLTRLSKNSPGLSNLKITKPSQIEEFYNPVLHTYGCYCHRVNERGADYWDVYYQTRNGYTPGIDLSGEEIDQGTREIFEGKKGSYLPDLSVTVYTPFYAKKAGYSNAFSTNFDVTIENLNKGVISWYMVNHGMSMDGGILSWWEPPSEMLTSAGMSEGLGKVADLILGGLTGSLPYTETNPWRGYEMWWGSTEEPDSAILNSKIGIIPGWTNEMRPRDLLNKGLFKVGLDVVPSHLAGYYDGQIGPYSITGMLTKFHYSHPATEVDDKLGNLHSMNFHAGSCLIGCNYFQILFMRHGSVLQEMDPWPTSYWSSYSFQQIPKDFALGKSVGESYVEGITEIGPQYIFEEGERRVWWWDTSENVVLFTDPDLHVWIPSTEYDPQERNHWDKEDIKSIRYDSELDIEGHMPFGATGYPNKREPESILITLIAVILLLAILVILIAVITKKRKK